MVPAEDVAVSRGELATWLQKGCDWLFAAVVCALLYVVVALFVFQVRHPWMTQMEGLFYVGRAVTFGTVDYEEARPRR